MRSLTRNVTVLVDGEFVQVGPGACPDRLARLITMPGVWEEDDLEVVDLEVEPGPVEPAPASDPGKVEPATEIVVPSEEPTAPTEVVRPRGNASRESWVAYAESLGLEVADLDRGDIIVAVEASSQS